MKIKLMRDRFNEANIYYTDYEGYSEIIWHDREDNALKRWFDNYKIDQYASFASDVEFLVVEEVPATTKHIKMRYLCRIDSDHPGHEGRDVIMDHTAPPPPMVFFAAKREYVPPPSKSVKDEMTAERFRQMADRFRGDRDFRMFDYGSPDFSAEYLREAIDSRITMQLLNTWSLKVVKSPVPRFFSGFDSSTEPSKTVIFTPPPSPKHRRNK